MEDEEILDRERIHKMRRTARKLASNRSKDRTVRKLPQAIMVVPAKRVLPMRSAINGNKRLTYMMLLGASLCAYMYDVDPDTLEYMFSTVSQAAQSHLGGILGNT